MLKVLREECETLKGYARGVAGGLLFGLPLLYTTEMWWLGFSLTPERLLLALLGNFLVLLILERYSGFRGDESILEQVQDAVVAQGLGVLVAVGMLALLNLLRADMGTEELVGRVVMQTISISIGISVAISQLGQQDSEQQENQKKRKQRAGFWGRQAIALAGAIFFGMHIAVTEEPLVLGYQMQGGQCLMLLCLTLVLVFSITFALDFRGETAVHEDARWHHVFVRDSVATTTTAVLCAAGLLWLFGRLDFDIGFLAMLQLVIALGFVTSMGAAAARLLI